MRPLLPLHFLLAGAALLVAAAGCSEPDESGSSEGATFGGYFLTGEDGQQPLAQLVDLQRLPIPTTLVVDGEGILREVHAGPIARR